MPKLTLSFKGRLIDVFHLKEGETRIGREPGCDISIDSLAVAPVNVSIMLEEQSCYLTNLDEDFPVLINHNRETSSELSHGDVIQIGKHTLSFSEDALELGADLYTKQESTDETKKNGAKPQAADTLSGILQIMNGDKFGRIIPLNRHMTRIGRTGGNCAMISRRESGYYITYLEGPAIPIVNKSSIGEETQLLVDGDIIEIGATQMQFHT